jgi:hypothetical protein
MNTLSIDNLSVISKFLDVNSFKNLKKTNKDHNKILERREFVNIYKQSYISQFLKNKNIYNFIEKNKMINTIYKYNNKEKYINILLLYIEKYFENKVKNIKNIDIYDFTYFICNTDIFNDISKYDIYNFLICRNILIKKYLSETNNKVKVIFILYLTRFFVAKFFDISWFSDFYNYENKHWESSYNQVLRDYLTSV